MQDLYKVLNNDERAVYSLRALYKTYGYTQYKMSKFEEYDLYVKNKEFLVSDSVITFTDTDGKLMALKPDVTLSIIKNSKDFKDGVKKVFYNENVYRVSKGTRSFKEIMQVGLECQGDIDDYTVTEVLYLASQSLDKISDSWVLDVSHLGVVFAVTDWLNLENSEKRKLISCLSEKNIDGIIDICQSQGVEQSKIDVITKLASLYGSPEIVIKELKAIALPKPALSALEQLELTVTELLRLDEKIKLNVDFSVVNDNGYYNGIVFKGFISGIPTSVLSGGQYDLLMQKMGTDKKAIGFAVYLDALKKLKDENSDYDVDTVIKYSVDTPLSKINDIIKEQNAESVLAVKVLPEKLTYRKLIDLTKENC